MTANKRCPGTSFTVTKPLIKTTRRYCNTLLGGVVSVSSPACICDVETETHAAFFRSHTSCRIGCLALYGHSDEHMHAPTTPTLMNCCSRLLYCLVRSHSSAFMSSVPTPHCWKAHSAVKRDCVLITDLTGMCRPGWCLASKPKVARKFRHLMLEWFHRIVLSTCPSIRSHECISEAKVGSLD